MSDKYISHISAAADLPCHVHLIESIDALIQLEKLEEWFSSVAYNTGDRSRPLSKQSNEPSVDWNNLKHI